MRLMIFGLLIAVGTLTAAAPAPQSTPCKVSDISVEKLKITESSIGLTRVTGIVLNNCAESVGVELKATLYNKADEVLTTQEFWPADEKNISAKSDWPFEWSTLAKGTERFTVKVIGVKAR